MDQADLTTPLLRSVSVTTSLIVIVVVPATTKTMPQKLLNFRDLSRKSLQKSSHFNVDNIRELSESFILFILFDFYVWLSGRLEFTAKGSL